MKARVITGSDNKKYKEMRALTQKKYRDKEGRYLVEGDNLVTEALAFGLAETVFVRENRPDLMQRYQGRETLGTEFLFLAEPLLNKACATETNQGVLAVVKKPAPDIERFMMAANKAAQNKECNGNLLVLDRLQDPGNLGTILRTATGAGLAGGIVLKGTADIFGPKTIRAAAGAVFRFPLYFADTPAQVAELCQSMGKRLIGTTPEGGRPYYEADLAKDVALVIGNEGNGMSREMLELCAERVYIPMAAGLESLNAAVAAGVLLYAGMSQGKKE